MTQSRNLLRVVLVGMAAVAVGAGGWFLASAGNAAERDAAAETQDASSSSTETAEVESRTLRVTEDLEGTLGYTGDRTVYNNLQGTLTSIAEEGTTVGRGETLYEVDGKPVALMFGPRPGWRDLKEGVEGRDVYQLEYNLQQLGYLYADDDDEDSDDEDDEDDSEDDEDDEDDSEDDEDSDDDDDSDDDEEPDTTFDADTTEAVRDWQRDVGMEVDGVVNLGEVVFLPSSLRVGEHRAETGAAAQPGAEILTGTSTAQAVTVQLDTGKREWVDVGDEVEIELPDGETTTGKVTQIGTQAQAVGEEGGEPTLEVTIELDDPEAVDGLDQAPVDVAVTRIERENVLTVPVTALVALLEGGYAIEVRDSDGGTTLVPVETGVFDDGYVEISGEGVEAGMTVVVPS